MERLCRHLLIFSLVAAALGRPGPSDGAAEPTLARLAFWVPSARLAEFAATYEAEVRPILDQHGLVPTAEPGRPTAAGVFSRLFVFASVPDLLTAQTALEKDPAWRALLVRLGHQYGIVEPDSLTRPDMKQIFGRKKGDAIKTSFQFYAAPAGAGTGVEARYGFRQGVWQNFGTREGMAYAVKDIFQDRRGHLWYAASGAGIVRYDGAEFRTFTVEDGLLSDQMSAIQEDGEGHLWFATGNWTGFADGVGVSRYDGTSCAGADAEAPCGSFAHFTTADGLASNTITSMVVDPTGHLWFGGVDGVSRYNGTNFVNFTTADGLVSNTITSIAVDPAGHLWFGGADGLSRYDGTGFVNFTTADGLLSNSVNRMVVDSTGHLWVSFYEGGVVRYDGERFVDMGLAGHRVFGMQSDRDGQLWFTSYRKGVFRFDGEEFTHFTTEDGLTTPQVYNVMEDRVGHLWFGTLGVGAIRYDGALFTNFTIDDGLASNRVFRIIEDGKGQLWFGSDGGVVSRYDGGQFTNFGPEQSGQSAGAQAEVRALAEDRDGHLWFGTRWVDDKGVSRYDGTDFAIIAKEDGLLSNFVFDIEVDDQGCLWFGTVEGASRYDGENWTNFTTADGLPSGAGGLFNRSVLSIAQTRDGNMWFGVWDGGVSRYDGTGFVNFSDTLIEGMVHTITQDRAGNVWFGGSGGLSRYDGREFVHFSSKIGLPGNSVTAVMEDRRGHFWIGVYGGGVVRYDGQVYQTLSRLDGLVSDSVQDIVEDKNGDFWIATEGGITRYRPSHAPPGIYIKEVIADRAYGPVAQLQLPSTQNVVLFEFGSRSFTTRPDQMVYVYRLQGHDEQWQQTRQPRVNYTDLPVGEYTFEVKAVDRDLNYSKEPARVALEVYHQPVSSSVSIDQLGLGDLFASFYKSYADRPLGSVVVANHDPDTVATTLRFFLPGLMRRPLDQELVLAPQSSQEVILQTGLEPSMLDIKDDQLLSAEVSLAFAVGEQTISIQEERDVRVYGRGALRWDDVGRAAAFVTTGDAQVAAFARQSLVAFENEIKARGKPLANLTRAMVLFEALKAHGLRYLADANSPYAQATADRSVIDHIQYPAELLQSKSGDCDDLTVLYASLLENAGVPTALVDYPGHIFLLFDTGLSRQEAYKLPMEARQYVVRGDRVWIPVEITRLDQPFAEAWKQGLDELARLSERDRRRLVVDTAEAWADYPPASPVFGDAVDAPERSAFADGLLAQYNERSAQVDQYIEDRYLDVLEREPDNQALRSELGRVYIALKLYDAAISVAYKYLRSPGGQQASTYNHLGIVHYFKGELDQAAFFLQQALDLAPEDEGIQRNLAKVRADLGEIEGGERDSDGGGDGGI